MNGGRGKGGWSEWNGDRKEKGNEWIDERWTRRRREGPRESPQRECIKAIMTHSVQISTPHHKKDNNLATRMQDTVSMRSLPVPIKALD